ncbi:MAG: kelch repeat-containing protein [Planctomycetota bacterium]|nr:kelch repeat-containing protein [Planctomycetota bacterium]
MKNLLGLAAALTLSLSAQAQTPNWTEVLPASSPSARTGLVGVSDGANLYIFGGNGPGGTPTSDLWAFDGAAWTVAAATGTGPSDRNQVQMAWDSSRGVLVLFGGQTTGNPTYHGDTWEWSSALGWVNKAPALAPVGRTASHMAYLPGVGAVLHGGKDSSGTILSDTWSWDGTSWTQLVDGPIARRSFKMVHRSLTGDLVLFGGRDSVAGYLADTWTFDGVSWTQIVTASAPGSATTPGMFAYQMYYDPGAGRTVIFSGSSANGIIKKTWEFDGVDWAEVFPAAQPPGRNGAAIAWVANAGKAMLFGGYNGTQKDDTWTRSVKTQGLFVVSGTGCPTSAGLTATVSSTAMPAIGSGLFLEFGNLTPGTLSYAVLGLSTTTWSGIPLPFPMSAIFPGSGVGCDLLVSPDKLIAVSSVSGTANLNVPIPSDPAFVGLPIHAQCVQIEVVGAGILAATSPVGSSVLGEF